MKVAGFVTQSLGNHQEAQRRGKPKVGLGGSLTPVLTSPLFVKKLTPVFKGAKKKGCRKVTHC